MSNYRTVRKLQLWDTTTYENRNPRMAPLRKAGHIFSHQPRSLKMFLALYKGNKKSLTQITAPQKSPKKKPRSGRHCGLSSPPPSSGFSLENSFVCTDGAGVQLIPGLGGGGLGPPNQRTAPPAHRGAPLFRARRVRHRFLFELLGKRNFSVGLEVVRPRNLKFRATILSRQGEDRCESGSNPGEWKERKSY